jgi:hypothetical protein
MNSKYLSGISSLQAAKPENKRENTHLISGALAFSALHFLSLGMKRW